jgi:hypothetical protein
MDDVYVEKLETHTQQRTEWLLRVDFYHRLNKQIFMDALQKHGPLFLHQVLDQLTNTQISKPTDLSIDVYIRDALTAYYSKLAYEARKIKKKTPISILLV